MKYKDKKNVNWWNHEIKIDCFKADIYSIGLTLLYTALGKKLVKSNSEEIFMNQCKDLYYLAYEKLH